MSRCAVLLAMVLAVSACADLEPFDYEAASPQEREAWLTDLAEETSRGFRNGLNSTGHVSRFTVEPPKVDARRRVVTLTAKPSGSTVYKIPYQKKQALMVKLCESYLRSPYYPANVRVIHDIKSGDYGGMKLISSPSKCEQIARDV